jgi:T5SS/PEP-CTERM-associated repeat protein
MRDTYRSDINKTMKGTIMLLRLFLATICILGPLSTIQAAITSTGEVQPSNPATWGRYTTIGIVGGSGYGAMTIDSGSDVSSGSVYFGLSSGPSYYGVGVGTITGTGSTLDSGIVFVGYGAYGSLNITAGGAVSDARGYIGHDASSTGNVTVSGSNSVWTNTLDFVVGVSGKATLDITNGGQVLNTSHSEVSDIGYFAGSSGMATVAGVGSTWAVSGNLNVGRFGEGTLNITDGGVVSDAHGYIGENSGAIGMVTVAGVGSTWTNSGRLDIGDYGSGILKISGGGSVDSTDSVIGGDLGAAGVVTVDGSGSTWTANGGIGVGVSGNGILNITHGGAVNATSVAINSQSWLAIDTSSSLNVGNSIGEFTNNGLVRISATANASAGIYAPIVAGGWFGTGTYQALGGTWNTNTHQFTVSTAQYGESGQTVTMDSSIAPRVVFTDTSGWSVGASFAATDDSTPLTFTATAISSTTQLSLQSLLGENQILGGWEFTAGEGYTQGSPVYLTFDVGEGFSADGLQVWHNHEGNWSPFAVSDLTYDGRYASFTVTGFSGYAVTTVPEPSTLILAACGLLGLLGYAGRRRRG